jgi:accessory gene regulator protein AgrB
LTERISDKLSRYFVLHGAAKEDDREVLAFMFFQIISLAQQVAALIIVAAVLDAFAHIAAFALFFASVKRYAGGAHADKHWVCLTVSTSLAAAAGLIGKLADVPFYITLALPVAAFALVLLRAPVIHPNNPKPERRKKKMRKVSVCIAAAQCGIIAIGVMLFPAVTLSAAVGGFAAAFTLILPVPKEESG